MHALDERALHRLRRPQVAGHAIGLWTVDAAAHSLPERLELSVAPAEMRYPMGHPARLHVVGAGLTDAENRVLEPLWEPMGWGGRAGGNRQASAVSRQRNRAENPGAE